MKRKILFYYLIKIKNLLIDEKPWESRPEDMGLNNFLKKKRSEIKHIRYDKPIREPAKFIESK